MFRMNRKIVAIFALALVISMPLASVEAASTKSRSESVVYLDGVKYYVHTVVAGDTLYSLAKTYGVSEQEILGENPGLKSGLMNIGFNMKIPFKVEEAERQPSDKKMKRLFDQHVVASGETLYSISRQYAISVAMIMSDNSELDPSHLAIGDSVNIRKTERGIVSEEQTAEEMDHYRQQLNKVAPEGLVYHLVEEGETLSSLASRFAMSLREIEKLNNLSRGAEVAEGAILLVNDTEVDLSQEDESTDGEPKELVKGDIKALAEDESLQIALLLPLSVQDYALKPIVEFYQGFLLGLEDLKREGRNVVLNLFNTEMNPETVGRIIEDEKFQSANLIVGPVYEESLSEVIEDAERRDVPVVSPLVDIKQSDSKVLFQMAPNMANRYDKLDDLFGIEQHVTLIYGESNDSLYEAQVLEIMARYNREIERYDYKYEHPSVISERERLSEEAIKIAEKEAEELGVMLDSLALDSLICEPSPSDLTPLISNGAVSNLFFVLSDNETEVDRILSALASAYTTQVANNRGSDVRMSEVLKFSVVENPEWRNYKNIDRTIYFRDRMYRFPSYVANRNAEVVRAFDGRYAEAFSGFPTQYSYRGYDVARIFGEGMYGNIEYNMAGEEYTPLQSTYIFEQAEDGERWLNTNWVRVRYNLDFTLKLE